MKNNKNIEIKGTVYTHLKDRVHTPNVAIYVSENGSEYLRIGEKSEVEREKSVHKDLLKGGFPVADIISEGEFDERYYFIEKSLGHDTISSLFTQDVNTYGYITEENFSAFLNICSVYAKAQLKGSTGVKSTEDFTKGFYLEELIEELPESKDLIVRAFDKVKEKLSSLPIVPSHGDFNPFNLFPAGVIDFEYVHAAPFGYDLISALYSTYFFPKSMEFELTQRYEFSKNQRATFIYAMDKLSTENRVPHFTYFTGEFILCRAVFAAVKMSRMPKLQAWRFKLLKALLVEYLEGRRIKLPALAESI